MEFSFELVREILPQLLRATVVTLQATAGGFLLSLLVGAGIYALSRSGSALWRGAARFTMEFFRATPLLVQLYFLFFVLPSIGIVLPPFGTGVLALGLHYGAYASEAYRAGIAAVPRGQWEAATALNFPRAAVYRHVILPQALPPVVPSLGNIFISMLKDTPVLAAVTVTELMFVANEVASERFQYTEPITAAAVIYLVLSLAAGALIQIVESRLAPAAEKP